MTLPFQIQKQLLQNWCWAAVSSSISFYYDNGSNWYQAQLAANLLDNSCGTINDQNAGQASTVCNKEFDVSKALQLTNNYAGEFDRALTMQELVSQINSNYLICCQMVWPSQASHFVVLFGYNTNNVIVGDPDADAGGVFQLDYNDFMYGYRGGGKWQRTIGSQSA